MEVSGSMEQASVVLVHALGLTSRVGTTLPGRCYPGGLFSRGPIPVTSLLVRRSFVERGPANNLKGVLHDV
jgi:hypothetical protein